MRRDGTGGVIGSGVNVIRLRGVVFFQILGLEVRITVQLVHAINQPFGDPRQFGTGQGRDGG
ncbi:hypothetical protein BSZ14_12060 [Sphingomonas sp. Sph1(2015)]|jgi:hypothetical protein|nr:hypothetical protein BSZ14_12060 [Sphingomonas sp. Sph1(2015)]